jgi:hypothetical protein
MRYWLLGLLFSFTLMVSAQGAPFAEGFIDNTLPYLGQPIVYTLRIYTVGEIAENRLIEPSFTGFGRASLILEATTSVEVIGTTLYQVVEQSYVLYPLRSGTATIEPFTIDLPETPFQSGLTLFTEPIKLEVQSLPENAPLNYKNAVGQFEIEASISTSEITSGDALTLTVSISGTGNLEQMIAPDISLPEGWRGFDSKIVSEQDNLRFGRKLFEWTVIPSGEGMTEIPSIEFVFFNPQSRQYEIRRTMPITLTLLASNAPAAPVIPTREVRNTNNAPPELKIISSGLPPYPPQWFWILWLIPPLIVFVFWLSTKTQSQPKPTRRRVQKGSRAIRELRKTLKQAQQAEPKIAYPGVETAIYTYLSAKFGESITFDNVTNFMNALPISLQEQVMVCIEEAHEGQYAPVAKADVIALLRQSLQVFTAVEEEMQ